MVKAKAINFDFTYTLVSDKDYEKYAKKVDPEIKRIKNAKGYDNVYASVNLPDDSENVSIVKKAVAEKKKLKPVAIVVIGIGGSNLGTIAVQEAVLGKLHNQTSPKVKIYYADTTDADSLNDILTIVKPLMKKGKVIINPISKSGGTTETIALNDIFVQAYKKEKKDWQKYFVITSGIGSKFWNYAEKENITLLPLEDQVGGRYSVFSTVGLFPLAMVGIDIANLLKGASDMKKQCLASVVTSPAAMSAITLYTLAKKGKTITDNFIFANDLESFGKWYRQLMGESIGKEYNKQKKKVYNGITPTVSIGSTDLHSMAQLYLGGPYDKSCTFIRIDKNKTKLSLSKQAYLDGLVPHIRGKKMEDIMHAILEGTQTAYMKGKRPFMDILLPDKSEESIGALLQFKMIEMMILGFLCNVNPFDQPNVEDYKVETKHILAHN